MAIDDEATKPLDAAKGSATAAAGQARPSASFWHKHGLKLAISAVMTGAFVWTFQRGGLPLIPPTAALEKVPLSTYLIYLALLAFWHLVRATRWRHLLAPIAPIPLRRIIAVSWIGFLAILLMPLRAGEFVRPYMIRHKGKVSVAAATGTIGAERVIDGLYLTVLLGLGLQIARPLSPLPDHIGKLQIPVAAVPAYAYLSLLGFLTAFALMGLFYWRPVIGRKLVDGTLGLVSPRLAGKVGDFVERTVDGLKFLPSLRYFGPFLFETALYWGINGLGTWVLARGCGINDITVPQAFVVMGVLGVGILVPAGPGLFGAFQASTYAALAMYFRDDVVLGPGGVFVFLLYVIQVGWHLLTGAFFLIVDREAAREVIEAETEGNLSGGPATP
jgi:hypothetical protein